MVVGDDKQIMPEAVGIPLDIVNRLKQEYLYDFEYASSFLPDNSLFEHAKLRSGKNLITLREHFRCMPEIIKFSNDLCYAETPLIPLRQYTSNRLIPLEHVFVENGYREGSGNSVVNPPEATAICNKIYDICRDEAYRDKSIGVVVLQGEQQAKLIQQKMLMTLPAEEIEGRGIICGNPYHFQGDERDVIILSMVAALNERNGTLSKPADELRFNVATSRARDQMILFHSVRRQDVSPNCLRARLLDFFEEIPVSKIASVDISDLEYHAYQDNRLQVKPPKPFDSWFEVDVGLELMRKKLNVFPQYKVAGKRIDFVIESHGYQLAIECDGDYWHGPEQYDQDMFRQRQLERCGWEFFRIRESAFYYDKNKCLEDLWAVLKCRNMI